MCKARKGMPGKLIIIHSKHGCAALHGCVCCHLHAPVHACCLEDQGQLASMTAALWRIASLKLSCSRIAAAIAYLMESAMQATMKHADQGPVPGDEPCCKLKPRAYQHWLQLCLGAEDHIVVIWEARWEKPAAHNNALLQVTQHGARTASDQKTQKALLGHRCKGRCLQPPP